MQRNFSSLFYTAEIEAATGSKQYFLFSLIFTLFLFFRNTYYDVTVFIVKFSL